MKWEGDRESSNVEDRRDEGYSGGGGGFSFGGGSLGIGTVVVALVAGWIFGINPLTLLSMFSGGPAPVVHQQPAPQPRSAEDDRMAKFVATTLAYTEDVWTAKFKQAGAQYTDPHLVMFRGATRTACGQGQAAMGPFYCPADQKVYIDLDFYQTLKNRLGAPGEFAQAYVIAHEVGHHVQNLMGISEKMDGLRGRVSEAQYNAMSVRLELQADCFAGIWAHDVQGMKPVIEQGDIASAMNAAAKIGDDALQRSAGRAVVPESFTHGTSAQRQHWFDTGYETGSVKSCDTFAARNV